MSSAARSSSAAQRTPAREPHEVIVGPAEICIDRPLLALDRPFTYSLADELGAGVGSLVRVRFHGKLVRGWVLGPATEVRDRILPVLTLVSPVRFFDPALLELYRWMAERYVAPLAAVIARSVPPRVASEETSVVAKGVLAERSGARSEAQPSRLERAGQGGATRGPGSRSEDPFGQRLLAEHYANGDALLEALDCGSGTHLLRTAPGDDAPLAVECVGAALASARSAIVLVPDVEPVSATVDAVLEAFGSDVACFFGGDKRSRYRMWLEIAAGLHRVVVGTRPAVFAPVRRLGLVYVAREHHTRYREERSPYFHVRDVAARRASIEGAVSVLSSVMPSLDAQSTTHADVEPRGRRWPPVEVVAPGPEGRAPRLIRALRTARRAFLFEPMRGYGVARVCRSCGESAACGACGSVLRLERGRVRCAVCEAPGRCATCGASDFGVVRGGVERVEEWARGIAPVPVARVGADDAPRPPGDAEVIVGGIEAVKDFGAVGLDLVGILNVDASLRRPGVAARERALSAWAEVAAWAGPDGRVIVQASRPNDPVVQALVAGRPDRFARTELPRRADAGFPVGAPVFRVVGTAALEEAVAALPHRTLLVTGLEDVTICLVVLDATEVPAFGAGARRLAERGVVVRVEAEPHL